MKFIKYFENFNDNDKYTLLAKQLVKYFVEEKFFYEEIEDIIETEGLTNNNLSHYYEIEEMAKVLIDALYAQIDFAYEWDIPGIDFTQEDFFMIWYGSTEEDPEDEEFSKGFDKSPLKKELINYLLTTKWYKFWLE